MWNLSMITIRWEPLTKKTYFLLHTSSLMTQLLVLLKRNIKDKGISLIHDICHFLYTGSIFKYKILHPKIHKNTQKIVNYVVFCVQSGKFYTWQNYFTRALPVVPVTNIRYAFFVTIRFCIDVWTNLVAITPDICHGHHGRCPCKIILSGV